jgi:hypothetical protein
MDAALDAADAFPEPEPEPDPELCIIGIDVGVRNLAMAVGWCTPEFTQLRISAVERVNLMDACMVAACELHHTGMAADRVAHFLQQRAETFAAAHTVVIERQPPGGLRDIEQVLLVHLRHKAVVMAPQTMHAAIGSSGLTYEDRKAVAVTTACGLVPDLATRFAPKPDDPADAVCFVLTYVRAAAARRAAICTKRAAEAAATASATAAVTAGLDLKTYMYTGRFAVPGFMTPSATPSG